MKKIAFFLLSLALLLSGCAPEPENLHDPERIVIALLDSGVCADAIGSDHLLPGWNYVTQSADTEDLLNHGTAVASTILGSQSAQVIGAAQAAYLVPLVVVSQVEGETTGVSPEILAQAIRESIDLYHADILCVSLGILKEDAALLEAVRYAYAQNIPVLAAVGNDGAQGQPLYPAAWDTVLAVGSCDQNGNPSEFSQDGADVLAPGEDLLLASRSGRPYGVKGTSFAAGFAAAHGAKLLMEDPSLTPAQLYEKLIEKARSCGGYLPWQ